MGTLDIAISLPTRNRPQLVARLVDSLYATADRPEWITVYAYVDDDDQLTVPALLKLQAVYPGRIKYMVGPRITLSDIHNKLYPLMTEDVMFVTGDDVVARTQGWDTQVLQKFNSVPDKILQVYGDDLYQGGPTNVFIHRRWADALGYLSPPYFSSDYSDTWLAELAKRLDRQYKLPFVMEHMHFANGKAPMDATYTENRRRYQQDRPDEVYKRLADLRDNDYNKLKRLLDTPYVRP